MIAGSCIHATWVDPPLPRSLDETNDFKIFLAFHPSLLLTALLQCPPKLAAMSVLAVAATHPPHPHHPSPSAPTPSSSSRPFACHYPNCNKTFPRVSKLQAHLCVHTGERPFPCTYDKCPSAFTSASKLQEHVKKAHTESGGGEATSKRFICDECGKGFGTGQHLRRHKEGVHDDASASATPVASTSTTPAPAPAARSSYPCTEDNCTASFTKRKHLRQHIWESHADPNSTDGEESLLPFPCSDPTCTKRFPTNSKRRSHYKVAHSGLRQYTCALHSGEDDADEGGVLHFPTWSALQTHMREVHPPTCPYEICKGKVFKRQENLRAHLQRHREKEEALEAAEGRGYVEDEDEDVLADDSEDEEEAAVVAAREFVCGWQPGNDTTASVTPACTKRFKSTHARDTHIRVAHLKLRPFACPCGKTYGHKHLLKRHEGKCKVAASERQGDEEQEQEEDEDASPGTPSELESDQEDEVYRRGGGALPDALRDEDARLPSHKRKRSDAGEKERPRPSLLVDLLTGRGYADGSSAPFSSLSAGGTTTATDSSKKRRRMRGRVVACPWPKFQRLVSSSSNGNEEREAAAHCSVRFSRLYDMRRHLKAAHQVEVEDDAELRALLDEEEVGRLAKPRRAASSRAMSEVGEA